MAQQPDKLLLHYGDENLDLSYAEFAARTRRMASLLALQGVSAGDHVSVHAQNALVTALSMFAIWRLGAGKMARPSVGRDDSRKKTGGRRQGNFV